MNVISEYPAVSGLSGSWGRPLQEYVRVTADSVPVTWSVDSAVLSASGPYTLAWQGRNPVSPVVRLTDSSSTALLQDWVVIFAVAFGITGSVLASLLFEWLRRPSRDDTAAVSAPASAHSPLPGRGSANSRAVSARVPAAWLALAGAVFLIGYARGRRAQARHP